MKLTMLKPRVATLKASPVRTITPGSWRGDKTSTGRGYGYKWQQARARFLKAHPLCSYCQREGRITLATVVDHIEPHRGDERLFWDQGNWMALCASCHSSVKQREEAKGEGGIASPGRPTF
ncbi:HNH endonuclease [Thauera chlorobenzoica]|uniref:HNH endonuclease n=1 Tax=Thauera chlorobenzoica TaxID=96773 RepID=UPI0008A03109|nr:HNH endonuclease signature motif containing protein [Thauera chlorobenzoica]SEF71738.1 HNH endonuclease [Thauera chlorobenzoica]